MYQNGNVSKCIKMYQNEQTFSMDHQQGMQRDERKGSEIPDGWVKCFSKKQNMDYYFHPGTGKSVWRLEDIPAIQDAGAQSNDANNKQSHSSIDSSSASNASSTHLNNQASSQTNDGVMVKRRRGVTGSSSTALPSTGTISKEKDSSLPITAGAIAASTKPLSFVQQSLEQLSNEEIERKNELEQFRDSALSRIKAFRDIAEDKKLVFEPCNSERRYLICEAADDLGLLTKEKSTTEDLEDAEVALAGRVIDEDEVREEEKFIVVYAQGYISEEEDNMQKNNTAGTYIKPKKSKRPTIFDKPPPFNPESFTNLNVIKRDRRSVEEIQKDLEIGKRKNR